MSNWALLFQVMFIAVVLATVVWLAVDAAAQQGYIQ